MVQTHTWHAHKHSEHRHIALALQFEITVTMSILELRGCNTGVTSLLMDMSRRRMISRSSARAQKPKKHDLFMFVGEMDVGIEEPVNMHATLYPVIKGKGRYTQSTDFEQSRGASNVTFPSSIDQPQ